MNNSINASVQKSSADPSLMTKVLNSIASGILKLINRKTAFILFFIISVSSLIFIVLMKYVPFIIDRVFISMSSFLVSCILFIKVPLFIFFLGTISKFTINTILFTCAIDFIFLLYNLRYTIKIRKKLKKTDLCLQCFFLFTFLFAIKILSILFVWPFIDYFSIITFFIACQSFCSVFEFIYNYTRAQKANDELSLFKFIFRRRVEDLKEKNTSLLELDITEEYEN